jgi:phosphoglycerol transferase MdoB-like AlkP superfamily enzyme
MSFKTILSFLRYFAFWLLFFFLERTVFLLYNYKRISEESSLEVLKAFLYGSWMDASMAGYFCAIPLIVALVIWFLPPARLSTIYLRIYTYILIFLCAVVAVINFNIYREWGSKVNYRVFEFAFGSPKEAMASTGSSPIFLSTLILVALTAAGILLFNWLLSGHIDKTGNFVFKIALGILMLGLNFLAIRGGWQLAPMNESMAYFSTKPILNYAAVNTEWGLATDIMNSKYNTSNPYHYFRNKEAEAIVKSYYQQTADSSLHILNEQKPNVVLIIMESFTGNVVSRLGGEEGISNSMDKLMEEGIFFDNIYASGGRTDKGVVAVLSGFPAQAGRSIMKENSKQVKIPSIPQSLNTLGYRSSFFYGGESRFFNMKSYLLSHGFSKIVEKENFDKKDMNSKWGAYDGAVYDRMQQDLGSEKQPFFATMLTLTNHEPFELPGNPHFKGAEIENKFRSTAYYADSCLGAFVNKAKQAGWYKHTLFVVVADHGHYLPRTDLEVFNPQRYRIPLLIFGGAIKPEFAGLKVGKIGSQTDIATTILKQVGLSTGKFTWGKDLFNSSTKDFAFFNWDQGLGFVTPDQTVTFDLVGKNVLFESSNSSIKNSNSALELKKEKAAAKAPDESALNAGKAFMQEVYQAYINF